MMTPEVKQRLIDIMNERIELAKEITTLKLQLQVRKRVHAFAQNMSEILDIKSITTDNLIDAVSKCNQVVKETHKLIEWFSEWDKPAAEGVPQDLQDLQDPQDLQGKTTCH